ncbi:PD40 domain-containing protein [Steroidobacter sp. S1-65]|uniref:PD40 domain-containing protein n=1 Tax=Steroidobacter gossypii TaxID=2805490 RepID=A0ABS1X6F2_9GAMM|nr:amidohydrolase family protein [Steroidobacter gossypii]MBM0108798.1 PD40 domain-containing protein [Steroidobacter gossypii]
MSRSRILLGALLATLAAAANAAEQAKKTWDVNAPPGERREIPIDVRSGTWISVDVSPDGSHVLFDLLGDLYELPIAGGEAKSLTSGLAWDMQPRYSPDGNTIVFTSDRGGGDNLWLMDRNGNALRQLTKEDFRLLNDPAWHPNGRYIAGRKHFTTRRSLGTGEIWLYNLDGGDGVQLVKRPSEDYQKELGEPTFSPDGKFLYYTQNATPGDRFIYAQDVNSEVFAIKRVELASGETSSAVTGAGGAVRPTPSPDGRYLAFIRRLRTPEALKTALYTQDLRSGEIQLRYADLDRDMQETWAVNGLYPRMDWTPDSKSIVFWAGGGIKRLDIATQAVQDIPFHVTGSRASIAPPRFQVEVAPDQVEARMVRFATVSPNGQRVVYESFGRLWIRDVNGGTPRQLTSDAGDAFELFPSWSRDGKQIVFVRWTDATLGAIHVVGAGGGKSRAVTKQPGHYYQPRFTPRGDAIVVQRSAGGDLTSPTWTKEPGLYRVPSSGGELEKLTDKGRNPHFVDGSDRIYFTEDADQAKEAEPAHQFVSVDARGKDRRVHARSNYASRIEISPNGEYLAFRENFNVYVVPMPPGGQLDLSPKTKSVRVLRASEIGGEYLNWTDGDTLTYTLGPDLYRSEMSALFAKPAAANGEAAPVYGQRIANLGSSRPADKPSGVVALTGARIVTMQGDQVIDNGVIIIRDNRITAVGAANSVQIPAEAKKLDLAGKTVMPGLIDIHAHGPQGVDDIIPQQNWSAIAHLGLGVTTVHDPSNNATEIFAAAEYQRAGLVFAPRTFSTGDVVYGARSEGLAHIDTIEDARHHIKRLKAQGAISVKNYNQPRRDQRQMVVTAARENGMMVVAEGGSLYPMDMNLIADGNTGLEHNNPPQRFYDDVLQYWPRTGVAYTPTLVVTYGGPGAEFLFYQESEVWAHPLLSRYVPPQVVQPRSVRRQMAPKTDYQPVFDSAANAKRLMELGVSVHIGAHGQREGLGSHWEMWAFVMGGMSPMQALQTATINPARYMGMDKDLGSIEPGKLADLLILDGNPLQDIRVTDDIAYVILNGRIYEGGTLAEQLTGNRKLAPLYWQK